MYKRQEKHRAFGVADFVFIQLAQFEIGNEDFPDTGVVPLQGMAAAVPLIEGCLLYTSRCV